MKIAIQPRHIKALLPLAGKSDARFYLNSIYLEANETQSRLVARNGHLLGVIKSDFGLDEGGSIAVIIPRYVADVLAKFKTEFVLEIGERKDLGIERDCTAIAEDTTKVGFTSMDGEYPNWRRVASLGAGEESSTAQFQSRYIAAFAKTAKALGDTHGNILIWHRGDEGAGVYIECDSNFFGVIMPINEKLRSGTPNWIAEEL